MDVGALLGFEGDGIDRAPQRLVDGPRKLGGAPRPLWGYDVADRGLVLTELRDERLSLRINCRDAATLGKRHPFQVIGIELLPRLLKQPLFGEGILGVED